MPTKKVTVKRESVQKPVKKRETKTAEVSTNTRNEEFQFGATKPTPKRMSKEERQAIINQALQAKPTTAKKGDYEYTIEETEYKPNKWVVVITPKGIIYQEPIPRYWDCNTFTNILASIPDKPIDSYNKISFNTEICKTSFEIKGIECYIISVPFEGSRRENTYGDPFNIRNSTKKVGGNIVFTGGDNGLTKEEATKVTERIIDILKNYEETIEEEE